MHRILNGLNVLINFILCSLVCLRLNYTKEKILFTSHNSILSLLIYAAFRNKYKITTIYCGQDIPSNLESVYKFFYKFFSDEFIDLKIQKFDHQKYYKAQVFPESFMEGLLLNSFMRLFSLDPIVNECKYKSYTQYALTEYARISLLIAEISDFKLIYLTDPFLSLTGIVAFAFLKKFKYAYGMEPSAFGYANKIVIYNNSHVVYDQLEIKKIYLSQVKSVFKIKNKLTKSFYEKDLCFNDKQSEINYSGKYVFFLNDFLDAPHHNYGFEYKTLSQLLIEVCENLNPEIELIIRLHPNSILSGQNMYQNIIETVKNIHPKVIIDNAQNSSPEFILNQKPTLIMSWYGTILIESIARGLNTVGFHPCNYSIFLGSKFFIARDKLFILKNIENELTNFTPNSSDIMCAQKFNQFRLGNLNTYQVKVVQSFRSVFYLDNISIMKKYINTIRIIFNITGIRRLEFLRI